MTSRTELLLIRHAPSRANGTLAGRTDVPADCSDRVAVAAMRAAIGQADSRVMSPALRCVQTADALWLDEAFGPYLRRPVIDPRLWEQDFGAWEGCATGELPNLGPLSPKALATMRPPHGESFADLCARAVPALSELAERGGRVAVVAHAGTIRAALALALGDHDGTCGAALAFQIAPLSLTRLTALPGGTFAIDAVNWTVPSVPGPASGTAA